MKAQVIDNKIVAIGENIVETDDNNVYEVDIDVLPLTEDGVLDYDKIFAATIVFTDNKITQLIIND